MSVYVTACGNMHSHIFTEKDRNNEEVAILYMERSTYMYYMLPKSRSCQHIICVSVCV